MLYRSAILAFHFPVERNPVGQNPSICILHCMLHMNVAEHRERNFFFPNEKIVLLFLPFMKAYSEKCLFLFFRKKTTTTTKTNLGLSPKFYSTS